MSDARQFQEKLNAELAKSAAALPGETSEYVQQAKMITDTVMLSYSKSKDEFMKFAKELDGGVVTAQEGMTAVLKQFTEKAVLLGQGEAGGAYGVPQIMEMMISRDKVDSKTFMKFAAYNRNPLLKSAVESAVDELAKTGANTAERFRVVNKILQQAVPNEVVMEMSNSAEGIIQAIKSAFLDPESGLLGLGRKLDLAIPRVDSLGRYVDRHGKVVAKAEDAFKDSASMFEILRQTVGGFVLPLTGILDILPQIYEPLTGLAKGFLDLRNVSQEFYNAFNSYTKWYENTAAEFGKQAQAALDAGNKAEYERLSKKSQAIAAKAKMGGTLNALNDLLKAFGAIDEAEYKSTANMLMDIENVNPAQMLKKMFSDLFNSKFMEDLGEAIGSLIGGVLKAVGDLMSNANDLAETGGFAKGLKKGFEKAKGGQGITLIFKNLFSIIGKTLMTLFKSAPMQMSIISALTVGMPILQGAITAGLTKIFTAVAAGAGASGGVAGVGATISGWLGAVGPALGLVAKFLPPVAAALGAIVLLGGGVENSMRQLQQIFGEIGHTLWGSISGIADVFGTVFGFIGDLGVGLGRLVNLVPGVNLQLDLLKIALFPITGALQALEIGLLGLNVVLTKVRSWLTNWFGSNEEKKARYEESVAADVKMRQAQGRQNAYNVSMQGEEALKKAMNNALYELSHSKELKASRSAELKAFVSEARAQLGVKPGVTSPPKPGAAPTVPPPKPGAPAPAAPAKIDPKVMEPVKAAVETGTSATQAVNSTTQGVRTAVDTAKTEATTHAQTQHKKTDLLVTGINNVKSALMAISSKVATQATLSSMAQNIANIDKVVSSGKMKVQADFNIEGGPLGGGSGGPAIFGSAAQKFGLTMTSGYRPGDPGLGAGHLHPVRQVRPGLSPRRHPLQDL
jgi:hypothetical protein